MRRVRHRVAVVAMVVAVATAAVATAVSWPAEAGPARQPKPQVSQGGYMELPSTSVEEWRVSVHAHRGSHRGGWSLDPQVCVETAGQRPDGADRRVAVWAMGCTDNLYFFFDRVGWSARTRGWVNTYVSERALHFRDGRWHGVGPAAERLDAVWVDVTWRGEGDIEPHVRVWGFPLSCYMLPPICMGAEDFLERPAQVSGTLSSPSTGFDLELWSRSGRMGYRPTDGSVR